MRAFEVFQNVDQDLLRLVNMLGHKLNRHLRLLLNGRLFQEIREKKQIIREDKILPVVSLLSITGENNCPRILEERAADGNVTSLELTAIASLVAAFQPNAIFEIGTFDGRTTLNMAANAPAEARITTLDLPKSKIYDTKLRIKSGDMKFIDKEKSGTRFHGTPYENRITQIYADSAAYNFKTIENSFDFIFIDGSHSYSYVISDTENARKLLRNGKGVLLWHDYGWPEVVKALNDYYRDDPWYSGLKNIEGTTLAVLVVK